MPGQHFIQAGRGERPIKRWTSWYDGKLVTTEGENILEKLDNWGIVELRKLKLVWSSLEEDIPQFKDWRPIDENGRGFRIFEYQNGDKLRLFFLSLLWRAAASDLSELRQIHLPSRQLERLAKMIVQQQPEPNYLFPMCLMQLSTKGPRHNFTPIPCKKPLDLDKQKSIRIFRFYLDGLVIHFHRDLNRKNWLNIGTMAVGANKELGVLTVPYEISAQLERNEFETRVAEEKFGNFIQKLI